MSQTQPDNPVSSPGEIARGIIDRGRENGWAGWDPYDGLASQLLEGDCPLCHQVTKLQLLEREGRTAWTQFFVRSPVNLRRLFLIPKTVNPKTLALFAMACMRMGKDDTARELLNMLIHMQRGGWGYPFPWQSRAFFAQPGAANAVATSFAGLAMLEGYTRYKNPAYLKSASGGCEFIATELPRTAGPDGICIGYVPSRQVVRTRNVKIPSQIYNANLLAARLLAETAFTLSEYSPPEIISQSEWLESWELLAAAAVRFAVSRQNSDGSWFYGEAGNQKWVDATHTGYILMSLKSLRGALARQSQVVADRPEKFLEDLETALVNGWSYFRNRLITPDGRVRFKSSSTYPWESHTAAVGILTCLSMRNLDPEAPALADKIARRAAAELYNKETGVFAFRKYRFWTNGTEYLRWSQAWMALAFSELTCH